MTTDFTKLGLDPDVQETGEGRTIVPGGKYKIVMVNSNLKDGKSSKGSKVLHVKNQIVEGKYIGVELPDYWNLLNPSKVCQDIGQGTLKTFCNSVGIPYPPPDISKGYGVPLMARIALEKDTYEGKEFEKNVIKGYSKFDDNAVKITTSSVEGW